MVKRMVLIVVTAFVLPLLLFAGAFAGGGFFPTYPGGVGFVLNSSRTMTAVIVLDPNGPVLVGAPETPTGTFGSIAVTKRRVSTAAATFQVQPSSSLGELRFGCNLLLTNQRFVEFAPGVPGLPLGGPGGSFGNWLASDVTSKLFAQLGVDLVDPANPNLVLRIPAITGVLSQRCVKFPKAKDSLDFLIFGGIIDKQSNPNPPGYPDRTIPGVTDPTQQWVSGFLVLEVSIGFWAQPGIPTP
jgi:hypothetical protein